MNKKDMVSVVVPVHNGESFLRENIKSILNQTYKNLEIIYVCDGCTDRTINILYEYSLVDFRLKLCIQEKNHGAAVARNIGMEQANGDWIIFLDSDDLFEVNMIEVMLDQAVKEQADMCCCFWSDLDSDCTSRVIDNGLLKLYCKTYPEIITLDEQKYIFQLVEYNVWTKLIHRSVYEKKDVCFLDIPNGEDAYFSIIAAIESRKIIYVEQVLVYYRSNYSRNTLSTFRQKKKNYVWEMYDKLFQYICKKEQSVSLKQSFYNSVCNDICILGNSEIYEDIFNVLYNNYWEKWGMKDRCIANNLNYINQEIYKKVCSGDKEPIDRETIIMRAKVHFVGDIVSKGHCSIWGCGSLGKKLLEELDILKISIQHVFDSDVKKIGSYISDKEVEVFEGEQIDNLIVTTPGYYEEIKNKVIGRVRNIYNLENEIYIF